MSKSGTSGRKGLQDWSEEDLEKWFMANPHVPDEPLLLVCRQKRISRVVDLLFIDKDRRLVVMEIKNEKTTRLALGQALEYLGAYHDYELDDLCEDFAEAEPGRDLRDEFRETFETTLESLSSERRVILTAPSFDVPSAVACSYLGTVMTGVTVSMLSATRTGAKFDLAWHTPPAPVRTRRLPGGLAMSPSGRRIFSVLKQGAKPLIWWVCRTDSGGHHALPTDKQQALLRTNRRVIPVDAIDGIDVSKQGSCWERKGESTKRARILGVVTTESGPQVVFVRVKHGDAPKVRTRPLGAFEDEWVLTRQAVPSWSELADGLTAARQGGLRGSAHRSRSSKAR